MFAVWIPNYGNDCNMSQWFCDVWRGIGFQSGLANLFLTHSRSPSHDALLEWLSLMHLSMLSPPLPSTKLAKSVDNLHNHFHFNYFTGAHLVTTDYFPGSPVKTLLGLCMTCWTLRELTVRANWWVNDLLQILFWSVSNGVTVADGGTQGLI